nr:hypothetical protein [Tanacetum cinerariifolium]
MAQEIEISKAFKPSRFLLLETASGDIRALVDSNGSTSADRGNEKVDRDPGNISEIKGLRRRVWDLEIQHEISQIRKMIRELELQRKMRKETESRYVVRDDVTRKRNEPRFDGDKEEVVNSDYEEAPVFDDDQYEAETENIFS